MGLVGYLRQVSGKAEFKVAYQSVFVLLSGLDLSDMGALMSGLGEDDVARKFKKMMAFIKPYQDSFTALEKVGYYILACDKD